MDIEQSNEPRMSGRGDGGALVRVERRRNWSDEEKLAILKETTAPGAIVSPAGRAGGGQGQCEFVVGQPPHTPRHQNVAARRATARPPKFARAPRARSRLPDAPLRPLKFA